MHLCFVHLDSFNRVILASVLYIPLVTIYDMEMEMFARLYTKKSVSFLYYH